MLEVILASQRMTAETNSVAIDSKNLQAGRSSPSEETNSPNYRALRNRHRLKAAFKTGKQTPGDDNLGRLSAPEHLSELAGTRGASHRRLSKQDCSAYGTDARYVEGHLCRK